MTKTCDMWTFRWQWHGIRILTFGSIFLNWVSFDDTNPTFKSYHVIHVDLPFFQV
jgi:hypothetical protein